jgi:ribosome-associated heat shock protein Hsp15
LPNRHYLTVSSSQEDFPMVLAKDTMLTLERASPVYGLSQPPKAERLDKWLWQARFFRQRSAAQKACQDGKIRVEGQNVTKAHFQIRQGQVLTFVQGPYVRIIKILALTERRQGAQIASRLYEDLAPPCPENRLPDID